MEEESEKYPSLPANYVSLKMLKELRQKEKEKKERKQKEKEEEEGRRRSEEEEERRLKEEEEEEKIREEQRKLLDSSIKTSFNRPYRNHPRRFVEKKVEQEGEKEIGSSAENPRIVDGVNGDRKEGEGRQRDARIRTDFNRPYRRNNRSKFEEEEREIDSSKDPVFGETKPNDALIKTSFNRPYNRRGRVENKEREIDDSSEKNPEEESKISVVNGADQTLKENAVRQPPDTRSKNTKNRGKSEEKEGEIDSSNTLEEELDVVVVSGEAGEGKSVKSRKKNRRRKWGEKSKERKAEAAGEGVRIGEKEKQPIKNGGDDTVMPMNPTVKNPAKDDDSKDEVKETTAKINSGVETTSVNQTVKITSRIGNLTVIEGNVVVRNIEKRNRSKVEMNGGGPNQFRGFRRGGYGHGGRLGGSGRGFRDGGRDGNFTWVPREDIK